MASSNVIRGLIVVAGLLAANAAVALDPQPPRIVSVRWTDGGPVGEPCALPRFSGNGRFLAFSCHSNELVPDDANGRSDSFVLDRTTGGVHLMSVSSAGAQMYYDSVGGIPSNDGDLSIFRGLGPLHPDYQPLPVLDIGHSAFYLRRRAAGQTDLLTRDAHGQALTSSTPGFDASPMRSEALFSYRGNLLLGPHQDPSLASQLWVRNWATNAIELISATPGGDLSNGGGLRATFSATGRYVLFGSVADDLGPPARFGVDNNIYLRDRELGNTERLTYPWQGGEFQEPFTLGEFPPKVSADGRFVVFPTRSSEIHPQSPTHGGTYVYLLDRQTAQLEMLSQTPGYPSFNSNADLSDDGRYIAWSTRNFSFDGPANPPADMRAIWVLDRQTGERVNVTASLGPLHRDNGIYLALSPDGSTIAFTWRVGDPAHPAFDRDVLYTVQLRGPPPAQPVPIGRTAWWLLGLLVVLAAYLSMRPGTPRRSCKTTGRVPT